MSRRLRIGMVGAGFIGQLAHLMNFAEVPNCEIVALAEFRPELRAKVARRFDIPRSYATHTELLQNPAVEAVVVVTPRPHTGPVVLDCLKAGKHVLSEKPMAGTVQQAELLLKTAKANQVHYVVGYMKRHDVGVQRAKELLDSLVGSGQIGPVIMARAHCFMGDSYCKADGHIVTDETVDYPDGGWPIYPDDFSEKKGKDYAFYLNTYSHNVNLLRHLFGRTPNIDFVKFDNQSGRLAVLDFGGFVTTLETGRFSDRSWDELVEIFFADGRLRLYTPPALLKNVPAKIEMYYAGNQQEVVLPQLDWTWAMRRQAQAFVDCVLSGAPSLTSAEDSIEDLRLIEAMWRRS